MQGKLDVSHSLTAVDIEWFMPLEQFKQRMGDFAHMVKSRQTRPGFSEVLIPGEQEARRVAKKSAGGVPIDDEVLADRLESIHQLFGQIPDTLEDVWVKIALEGEQEAKQLIDRTSATRNPFDAKYSKVEDAEWETCSQVLDQHGALPRGRLPEPRPPASWALRAGAGCGRSSRDDSHLVALSLHSGCPGARHPFGAGLSPALQAQRVALGLKPALRWLKCAAVRRWIAQLGSFARVVDGLVTRPVRSVARGG